MVSRWCFLDPRKWVRSLLGSVLAPKSGQKGNAPSSTKNRFVACVSGVVHRIPLSCGDGYLGQTDRCLNDRLRGHSYPLRATVEGLLPLHCRVCTCKPKFSGVTVLDKHRDRVFGKIIEASFISCLGLGCVGEPSVSLSGNELGYLRSTMRGIKWPLICPTILTKKGICCLGGACVMII